MLQLLAFILLLHNILLNQLFLNIAVAHIHHALFLKAEIAEVKYADAAKQLNLLSGPSL